MRKITKLVVLLLTLSLLIGSVFAITALAADEATTESVTTNAYGGSLAGRDSHITSGYYYRYGEYSYRYASVNTDGHSVLVTNRTPTAEELEWMNGKTSISCQYTSNKTLPGKFVDQQYLVLNMDIGTNNNFFLNENGSAQAGLQIGVATGSGKNHTVYLTQKDGSIYLGNGRTKTDLGKLGDLTETGASAHVTFVIEPASTVKASLIHVFINGNYTNKITMTGATSATNNETALTMRLQVDSVAYNAVDQSVYLDNLSYSVVNGSDASTVGDIAALMNVFGKLGSDAVYNDLAQWTKNGVYAAPTPNEVAADENTVGIKYNGFYAQYTVDDLVAAKLFNKESDVTLTLLEDLVYNPVIELSSETAGTSSSPIGASLTLFEIRDAGKKTLNLNGHNLSCTPTAYLKNADPSSATPTNSYTFYLYDNVNLTINGLSEDGTERGSITRSASHWALFKGEANASTNEHNITINDVDISIKGGYFNDQRNDTFHYTFNNVNLTHDNADANVSGTSVTATHLNLAKKNDRDNSVTFNNSTFKAGSIGNTVIVIDGGDVSLAGLTSCDITVNSGTVDASSLKDSELTVKSGTTVITGNVSGSTVTVSGKDTKFGAGMKTSLTATTANAKMTSTTLNSTDAAIQTNDVGDGVVADVTGGSWLFRGSVTNAELDLTGVKTTFYASISGGKLVANGGSLLFGSNVKTFTDVDITLTNNNFSLSDAASATYTFTNVTLDVDGGELNLTRKCTFVDCPSVSVKNATATLNGPSFQNAAEEAGNVLFENCEIEVTSTVYFISYVNATLKDSSVESNTNAFRMVKDDNGTTLDGTGTASSSTFVVLNIKWNMTHNENYYIAGADYSKVTIGAGTMSNVAGTINGQTYNIEEGCYLAPIAEGTDDYEAGYRYVVKKLDFSALKPMANLTLYTDINYNIYLPVDEAKELLTKVNGTALDDLEQITDNAAGKVYYIITKNVAIHEADKSIEISFTPVNAGFAVYNLKKTVSVTDYISTVYGDAKYADSFALMSDLVDYADEAITYFGGSAENAFATFKTNDNYAPTELEAVPATTTDRSGLSGYIANSCLNLEKSNVKFVFTVATAGEYTVSYESADGTIVTETVTRAEGEELTVELRAYDLNAVITITTGTATGTYDLAAYAADVKDVNAEAYALVLEMYNYAVSAKAYKFGN